MKKMISAAALAGVLLAGSSIPAFSQVTDSAYTVRGYVPGQKDGKVYVSWRANANRYVDSAEIKGGRFEIKGFVQTPVEANLYSNFTPGASYISAKFYLEPGNIIAMGYEGNDDVIVQGGQTQAEYLLFEKLTESFGKRLNALMSKKYEFRENPDSVKAAVLEMRQWSKDRSKFVLEFISRYPDSYVSWGQILDATVVIDPEFMDAALAAISPRFRDSKEGKQIAEQTTVVKRTMIGAPAMEIAQPDVNGKMVKLSSFRGKYVFIDFWASWCGPCRMENPWVVKAYDRYKNKGFDVLGVSMDNKEQKEKWIQAIKDDKLPWTHISDLKGMKTNAAAVDYGIRAIPQNFLVDPKGVIVARNLRGEDLLVTMDEIMKDK